MPAGAPQSAALVRAGAAGESAQPAEDATWAAGSTAPLQRSSETAASAAATAPAPAANAAEPAHPAGGRGTAALRSDAAWLNGGGSAAQPTTTTRAVEELPVAAALLESINTLSKDVQIRLRYVCDALCALPDLPNVTSHLCTDVSKQP